jgi:hypothetical protein
VHRDLTLLRKLICLGRQAVKCLDPLHDSVVPIPALRQFSYMSSIYIYGQTCYRYQNAARKTSQHILDQDMFQIMSLIEIYNIYNSSRLKSFHSCTCFFASLAISLNYNLDGLLECLLKKILNYKIINFIIL